MRKKTKDLIDKIPDDATSVVLTVGHVPKSSSEHDSQEITRVWVYYHITREGNEPIKGYIRNGMFAELPSARTTAQEAWAHLAARRFNVRIAREEIPYQSNID